MPAPATLILVVAACTTLHLCAMALASTLLGLRVLEFSFGFGPRCLKVGRFQLGLLPLGGWIRFTQLPEEVLTPGAQLLLALSGVAASLVVSVVLLGASGLLACVDGLRQLVAGAATPLHGGQRMLAAVCHQAAFGPPGETLGLASAKVAALNLLPWPGTNGGQPMAVLGRRLGIAGGWPEGLTAVLSFLGRVVLVGWLVAVAVFLTHR